MTNMSLKIEDAPHPHNLPNIPSSDYTGNWWAHPDRPCKGKAAYADLTLIPTKGRDAKVEAMRVACLSCPVLRQCREDMLATMSTYQIYGVRAGYRGLT